MKELLKKWLAFAEELSDKWQADGADDREVNDSDAAELNDLVQLTKNALEDKPPCPVCGSGDWSCGH